MRKLAVSTFLTLDGVMQAPGGPEEDPSGSFEHGGWSVNYWDDVMGKVMDEAVSVPFDLLLGRKTYEIFAAHWPYAGDEPMATILNKATKYVASTTLKELTWSNSQLIRGDVAEEIARLKGQDGPEIQVHGSSGLIQTLLAHDLIDEYRLWTFPVVVGKGKRLFGEGAKPSGMALVDSKMSTTGVSMNTYRRAGPIQPGSFALEKPTEVEVERRRKMAREAT
ncbi:MAG TPA: dihydrofolate reductase family protein [bacterium]|jgi:dihydrofolate reductase|nr:dihydrofolate reductase family protein [bacterium]